jgi:4-hydroxy-3-methylbut-2-en-1-yl diphosphate reductase
MEALLAQPRGFCAGVVRAIEIVERALEIHGRPVYVVHEIVHNRHVVDRLRELGAVFVEDVDAVPRGAVAVLSAHGVASRVFRRATARRLRVIDAICPLVAKVHLQAQRYARQGRAVVLIGHAGHPEVEGTRGSVDGEVHVVATEAEIEALPLAPGAPLAYVTQTTLSLDDTRQLIAALVRRFPAIEGPDVDDICYATQNRQAAVRGMAGQVDLVLVVGARNSSNSNRLREVAAQAGVIAHLVEDASEIDSRWLQGVERIGVTAGASAPESLVQGVLARLAGLGGLSVRQLEGPAESVTFRLPLAALRASVREPRQSAGASFPAPSPV